MAAAVPTQPYRGPELRSPELKELQSFLDGAIMDVGIRHHLWRSWGLCERHGWCYAVVELEIRGGRPFSTAILYEDLALRSGRWCASSSRSGASRAARAASAAPASSADRTSLRASRPTRPSSGASSRRSRAGWDGSSRR